MMGLKLNHVSKWGPSKPKINMKEVLYAELARR